MLAPPQSHLFKGKVRSSYEAVKEIILSLLFSPPPPQLLGEEVQISPRVGKSIDTNDFSLHSANSGVCLMAFAVMRLCLQTTSKYPIHIHADIEPHK